MSNSVDATLQDAFDLIEQNKLEEARSLLDPLLETGSNNPAVWWVYAHAVESPEVGREALDKVVQLDPTYPGANELKSQLVISQPETTEPTETIDDWDDLTFEPDSEFSDSSSGNRSPIRFLLIAILVIIGVIGLFAILSGALGGSTPTPSPVAQVETEVPTDVSQIVPTNDSDTEDPTEIPPTEEDIVTPTDTSTDIPPIEEPTDVPPTEEDIVTPTDAPTNIPPTEEPTESVSYLASLVTALADYDIAESDIETRTTPIGETVDVSVCATPGPESSIILNEVMDILVEVDSSIPDDIDAVAVSLVDCASDDASPRTIGVERSVVQSFFSSEIELKDFQRAWQPLP